MHEALQMWHEKLLQAHTGRDEGATIKVCTVVSVCMALGQGLIVARFDALSTFIRVCAVMVCGWRCPHCVCAWCEPHWVADGSSSCTETSAPPHIVSARVLTTA